MANFIIKTCIMCGKEFKTQHKARLLCSDECKKERQRQVHQQNSQLERDLNQASLKAVALEYKLPFESLAEYNGKARERHMSYGQYYTWRYFN